MCFVRCAKLYSGYALPILRCWRYMKCLLANVQRRSCHSRLRSAGTRELCVIGTPNRQIVVKTQTPGGVWLMRRSFPGYVETLTARRQLQHRGRQHIR